MGRDDRSPRAPAVSPLPAPLSAVGLVVAMEAELRHLLERVAVEGEVNDGPWRDRRVTIGDVPVIAVCSGMGMVNAAAGTEHLIAAHRPRAILNYGCTGAHTRQILPGDVVIGAAAVNHAAVHILPGGEEYFVGSRYEVGGETMAAASLPADPALLALARAAAADWTPEPWPGDLFWPPGVPYRDPVVHVGVVASADTWTQSQPRLDLLHGRHQSLCEDMEAAAIAQICARHQTPFLTIKDISNNEFHAATDILGGFTDFPTAEVGKRAAALVIRLIERLGRQDVPAADAP
jgi:adenosylhomocysteine nucleosidase